MSFAQGTWYRRGTNNGWGTTKMEYDNYSGLHYLNNVLFVVGDANGPVRFKIDDYRANWSLSYPQSGDYADIGSGYYRITFNEVTKEIKTILQKPYVNG